MMQNLLAIHLELNMLAFLCNIPTECSIVIRLWVTITLHVLQKLILCNLCHALRSVSQTITTFSASSSSSASLPPSVQSTMSIFFNYFVQVGFHFNPSHFSSPHPKISHIISTTSHFVSTIGYQQRCLKRRGCICMWCYAELPHRMLYWRFQRSQRCFVLTTAVDVNARLLI